MIEWVRGCLGDFFDEFQHNVLVVLVFLFMFGLVNGFTILMIQKFGWVIGLLI